MGVRQQALGNREFKGVYNALQIDTQQQLQQTGEYVLPVYHFVPLDRSPSFVVCTDACRHVRERQIFIYIYPSRLALWGRLFENFYLFLDYDLLHDKRGRTRGCHASLCYLNRNHYVRDFIS